LLGFEEEEEEKKPDEDEEKDENGDPVVNSYHIPLTRVQKIHQFKECM